MRAADLAFMPVYPGLEAEATLPPRTRLYLLPPIGVGTPAAEGLTSYIIRLAEAHSVSPRRLIMDEFTKVCPAIAKYRRHGPFFETNARSINGLHRYSKLFIGILQKLCGLSAAEYLTMHALRGLLPFNGAGLIAPNPRWCPSCYAEMRESDQAIYQPLAWSFELYRVCSRHGTAMAERCPACGKLQYVIPRGPAIGYCSHCGNWLGRRPDISPPASAFDLWISAAIEEITAELPRLRNLAIRDRFVAKLNKAINRRAEGNRRRFCREIGLPLDALQACLGGNERPTLPLWLEISYGMSIGPVRFLEQNLASMATHAPLRQLAGQLKHRASRTQLAPAQRQAIEEELKAVVAAGDGSISVTALAERHQLTRSCLKYLWPDLCRRISANFRETAKAVAKKELAQKCRLATAAVNTLLEQGIYPSQRMMRNALDRLGISMADPAIREAYIEQLKARLGQE